MEKISSFAFEVVYGAASASENVLGYLAFKGTHNTKTGTCIVRAASAHDCHDMSKFNSGPCYYMFISNFPVTNGVLEVDCGII